MYTMYTYRLYKSIYIQFYTHIHITYMPGCIWGDAVAACELRVAGCRVLVGA